MLNLIVGCLEIDKEFGLLGNYADNCVKQTVGWNYSWINDRLMPRHPCVVCQSYATEVGTLIKKNVPMEFGRIGVEEGNSMERSLANQPNNKLCNASFFNLMMMMIMTAILRF
jgi:hypothetical protein